VLQDREQTLSLIDTLLQQLPITSQHLADFTTQHQDLVTTALAGRKDDTGDSSLLTADSDSDGVNMSADTTDSASATPKNMATPRTASNTDYTERLRSHGYVQC